MEDRAKQKETIAADEWIPIILALVKEGKLMKLHPHGFSMYPFLVSDRDYVILKDITAPLKRGDIVLYRRQNGLHVLHRIHHIDIAKNQYYMLGDSQSWIEGPLEREQLLAVAVQLGRKNKIYHCSSYSFQMISKLWMLLRPFRGLIIRIHSKLQRVTNRAELLAASKQKG